ncbi:PREDICTED: UPF0426 protein At1g28150, chloroplastic [Tarenaya hassleriana]|uniref:UPF0426 protein At1g28150, chloroplastic n=1 Tax=Tarenaya hassleriana TaxID=28532 RepID=UPI00053C162C|nr:PREDICTED: UPF0426 protein At1g28150, chloroplastic [Tarenaya hassleriana]
MSFVMTNSCSSPPLVGFSKLRQISVGTRRGETLFRPPFSSARRNLSVKSFCFNLPQEPILSEALKEPVAFVGGMFAGLLRLDLNEDPLKEWVTRTVEASGFSEEEVAEDGMDSGEEEAPQQIEIE